MALRLRVFFGGFGKLVDLFEEVDDFHAADGGGVVMEAEDGRGLEDQRAVNTDVHVRRSSRLTGFYRLGIAERDEFPADAFLVAHGERNVAKKERDKLRLRPRFANPVEEFECPSGLLR